MTVPILDLPLYLKSPEPEIFIKLSATTTKDVRFFLSSVCSQSGGGGGGSSGPCEDDRPNTGMLYPRG